MNLRFLAYTLLFLPSLSTASSIQIESVETRLKEAALVVRGKAGRQEIRAVRGPDGLERPYTFTEIKLDEVLKGTVAGSQLEVREIGGELPDGPEGSTSLSVPGAVNFEDGEEVVLLLDAAASDGSYPIHNMGMGKFNLKTVGQRTLLVGSAAEHEEKTWTLQGMRQHLGQTMPGATGLRPSPAMDQGQPALGDQKIDAPIQAQPEAKVTPPAAPLATGGMGRILIALLCLGIIFLTLRFRRKPR